MKITIKWLKTKLKIKNVNNNKRMSEAYIRQYKQNTFADGRITQYMHQIVVFIFWLLNKSGIIPI